MSDASKRKAKQKWAVEKPKLDNARQSRGIFFIEPEDEDFKNIMKNARRKLEIPMPAVAAMPCKIPINNGRESTRIRLEGAPYRYHEYHSAAKGIKSLSHYNLVHKFSNTSSVDNTRCEGCSGESMGKLKKIPAWQLTKVRNKNEVIDQARNEGRKVQAPSRLVKNSELEP